jgi:hypothetical protein
MQTKDIHKEMFPVYGGKCLSRKAVHNWVEKFSQRFADDEEVETEVRKWLRRQSTCCGFRRTGNAMGQGYQCSWRICREINVFFQVRISHVLRFISICGLFTDTPSYLLTGKQNQGKLFLLDPVLTTAANLQTTLAVSLLTLRMVN